MAEYIDRNLIEWYGCDFENASCENRECSGCSHAECSHSQVMQIPTADVIERAEYEKVLEENKQLKHIISDKVDKDLKCAFEVKELRSKIDNALADMQSMFNQEVLNDNVTSDVGLGIAIAMGLLKENIGE